MESNYRVTLAARDGGQKPPLVQPSAPFIRKLRRLPVGVLILLALLVLLIGYPVFLLVTTSLQVTNAQGVQGWGLGNYVSLLHHLDWISHTLIVAIFSTALATALAVVLSWILNRTAIPCRGLFETLIPIPYYMTPLVGGLAWSALGAPQSGLINRVFQSITGSSVSVINITSELGIIFVMASFEMPAAYLMIAAAMRGMDPSLEEGSAVLGGGKFVTAWKVTVPLIKPAILSAALFLFTMSLGAFAIPAVLGTSSRFYVVTTAIFVLFEGFPPNYPLAAALGVVLILFTVIALWLYTRAIGKRSYSVISGRMYRQRLIKMGKWTPLLIGICVVYILVGVVLPLGVLIYASIQPGDVIQFDPARLTLSHYYYILFEYAPTRQALWNSVLLGALTGTVGVILAGLISWAVMRTKVFGRRLLEYIAMFPQAIPGLVFAAGLLWAWMILPGGLAGTIWLLLLAYVTIFLPLGVRGLSGVIIQIDNSLEEASRVLGGGWLRTTWKITLPLLRPGIAASWMLLFISAIREVSSSMLLSSPKSRVLGPTIYSFWESGGMAQVSALAVVQTVIILVALILMRYFVENKFNH